MKEIRKKIDTHFRLSGVEFYLQDPFTAPEVSLKRVAKKVLSSIPPHFFKNLDSIYVGDYDFLRQRGLDASLINGGIFVSTHKHSEDDVCDDIVHEVAHLVEEEYGDLIYSDNSIESEFLAKRKQLLGILNSEGYSIDYMQFLDIDYNVSLDSFLYQEVGYPNLSVMTVNLFCSPYGATSIREYFANCFEYFFWDKDVDRVKKISPKVFAKLIKLLYYKDKHEI